MEIGTLSNLNFGSNAIDKNQIKAVQEILHLLHHYSFAPK
jgi:hypothetical protein